MSNPNQSWQSLSDSLRELEESDPAVKAAAEKYDQAMQNLRDKVDRDRIHKEVRDE